MKKLLLLIIIISGNIFAQQTVVVAYGSIAQGATTGNRMTIIAGQAMVGDAEATDYSYSTSLGFWGILKLPPLTPIVYATDGDFSNRTEITWELDPLSPPAKSGFKLYRNTSLISEINSTSDAYQDYNVIAGDYYDYKLVGINEYGDGSAGYDVGFVNPNGVITGQVLTQEGAPSVGTEVYLSPQLGKSLNFNGDGEVIIPEGDRDSTYLKDVLGISDELSIEMWFYSDGSASQQMIFFSGDRASSGGLYSYIDLVSDGRIKIRLLQENIYTPLESFSPNVWHHLAITAKSNTISTYVDGNLVDSYEHSVFLLEGELWRFVYGDIIFGHYSNVSPSLFLNGKLDDIRIWNTARTEDQIQTNMNRSVDNDDDGLVAYWKFDEGNGDWVFDQTTNNLDGNIDNAVWSEETAGIKTSAFSDTDGNYLLSGIYFGSGETFSVIPEKKTPLGSSIEFDGTNFIEFDTDTTFFSKDAFSISFWYNMNTGGSEEDLFIQKTDDTEYLKIFKHSTDQISVQGRFGSDWLNTDFNEITAITEGTWYYISTVFDKTNLTLSLYEQDGTLFDKTSLGVTSSRTIPDTSSSFLGNNAHGFIDEFMYWKTALSDEELLANMNGKSINLNSYGNYDEPTDSNLIVYLKMNEGTGANLTDESLNGLNATLLDTSSWNESEMPLDEVFDHVYNPASRYVTLNNSNTSKDDVEFTDVSLIKVTGYVRFAETSCYQDSVEILLDGQSADSPIYTDANGKFTAELEPGSSVILSPSYSDHVFEPVSYEVINLTEPKSGIVFDNTTIRMLAVNVFGGDCRYPIRPETGEITVTLTSISGCFEQELTAPTLGDITYEFTGVPPQDYTVTIDHPVSAIRDALPGQSISLRTIETDSLGNELDFEMDFMYQADLQVAITDGFTENSCGEIVLGELSSNTIKIKAFESYYDLGVQNICAIDSGAIKISDELSGIGDTSFVFGKYFAAFDSSSHKLSYSFVSGEPNIISPYKKQIQIVVTDIYGREAITTEEAIVLGSRARESTFVSHTPDETPVMILRDPPGDQSYGYVEKGTTLSSTISVGHVDQAINTTFKTGSYGPTFDFSAGAFVTVGFTLDVIANETWNWGDEDYDTETDVDTYEFSTNKVITTAEDPFGGDVFVGGAINLVYGIIDSLIYDEESCSFSIANGIAVQPAGFRTSYTYSEHHIKNVLIPQLEILSVDLTIEESKRDSLTASLERWADLLAFNDSLKETASFVDNISIDAYSTLDYFEKTDSTTSYTIYYEDSYFNEHSEEYGAIVAGFGGTRGWIAFTQSINIHDSTSSSGNSSTYGYHLADDDPGDYFSVDVKKDPVYGTFVFETKNGQSKCPWEENTLPRQGVQLNPTIFNAVNISPSDAAIFEIELGNLSQSDETWPYELKLVNESNPDGAIVKVNGITMGADPIEFEVEPGVATNAIISIEKGPYASSYEGIQLQFYSACEDEFDDLLGRDPTVADFASFSVSFIDPCSEINISSIEDNWLVTDGDEADTLWVTIDEYDLWNEDISELKLQYRKRVLSGSTKSSEIVSTISKPNNNSVLKTSQIKSENQKVSLNKPVLNNVSDIKNISKLSTLGGKDKTAIDLWIDIQESIVDSFSIRNIVTETSEGVFDTTSRTENYSIVPWKIKDLPDGVYELRAVVECGIVEASGVSVPLLGKIDRTGPALVGTPSPVDAILGVDDIISFVFDEDVDCDKIDPIEDVKLVNTETGASVEFDYNCTNKTIVFTVTELNVNVENSILKATVTNIYDKYGNGIGETIYSHEFYVDRNPIRWDGGDLTFVKLDDEEVTEKRQLKNSGGQSYSYTITDVPDWLTVYPLSGIVQAQSALDITFSVGSDSSHGQYFDTLYAESTEGREQIIVGMDIMCNPPDWEIQPAQFEHSMVIVANLEVADAISNDLCDVMYAFVGDELRGVAQLQYFAGIDSTYPSVNPYQAFMTVYSNVAEGEVIVLRVWDSSERQIVTQLGNYYDFVSNDIIGSPTQPDTIQTSGLVMQETFMVQGWNWFSPNLTNTDMSIDYVLSSLSPDTSSIIKNNSLFSEHSLGFWTGSISELSDTSMYMIKLSQDDTLQYFGEAVDLETNSFIINSGWNWIGYQPTSAMEINDALVSLSPDSGDVIKSQRYFSTYLENIGWVGSLVELEPQNGYKIKLVGEDTLIFPAPSNNSFIEPPSALTKAASFNGNAVKNKINVEELKNPKGGSQENQTVNIKTQLKTNDNIYPEEWIINPNDFEFNMNIVGIMDEVLRDSIGGDDLVGAFVNGECRGTVSPIYIQSVGKDLFFLTIFSNKVEGDTITFATYKKDTKQRIELEEQANFFVNNVLGSASEPFIWSLNITGIWDEGFIPDRYSISQNYPNPFNPTTQIEYGLPYNSEVSITVFNILGQRVATLINEEKSSGYYKLMWNGRNDYNQQIASGVYIYRIVAKSKKDTFMQSKKLIFLK